MKLSQHSARALHATEAQCHRVASLECEIHRSGGSARHLRHLESELRAARSLARREARRVERALRDEEGED